MQQLPDDVKLRHLARVVESSDDAIVSKDLNGIITSWNPAAERMFGYTAAEAIGQSIRMLDPRRICRTKKTWCSRRFAPAERVDHYETIRQHKDGTRLIDLADRLADSQRDRRDRRRVEDRARHHRAGAADARLPREHAANTEKLGEVGAIVASTLDRETIVQKVTDIATRADAAPSSARSSTT